MHAGPTVFVVTADAAVGDSLASLAKASRRAAECYGSAKDFLGSVDPSRPGCVVLDLLLGEMDGVELYERLKTQGVSLPAVFLSYDGDVGRAVRAMKAGAMDVLEMPLSPIQMKEVLRQAIERDASRRKQRRRRDDLDRRMAQLTRGERAVMEQIILGKTNRDIVSDLEISLRTFHYRRSNLMKKLGVRTRGALIETIVSARETPRDL